MCVLCCVAPLVAFLLRSPPFQCDQIVCVWCAVSPQRDDALFFGRFSPPLIRDVALFFARFYPPFSFVPDFKVTLSMLLASKNHPHRCQLCLSDVGGYPSIATPTEEKDDRGYTGGEEVCVRLRFCIVFSTPHTPDVKLNVCIAHLNFVSTHARHLLRHGTAPNSVRYREPILLCVCVCVS